MPSAKLKIFQKVSLDVSLLCIAALPVLVFFIAGKPFQRGFFCNDESIRYPYSDSTVTSLALYLVGTGLPLAFILLNEYLRPLALGQSRPPSFATYFWNVYCYVGAFLFGCGVSHTIVDICKYSIGRLRPHFIEVCNPDFSLLECNENPYAYVAANETICRGGETDALIEHRQREARLSFMSGHASFSTFTMVYLVLYLQARFVTRIRIPLLKPLLQQCCMVISIFTCLSRVHDYKHHWSDVLAGFINGLVFAILVARYVAKLFNERDSACQSKSEADLPLEDNLQRVTVSQHPA